MFDDRGVGEVTIAGHQVAARLLDPLAERYSDRHRDRLVSVPPPPHPIDTCGLVHRRDCGTREGQQIPAGAPIPWACRWHGAWYVICSGISPVNAVSNVVSAPTCRPSRYSAGIERVRGDQFGVRPSRIADVVGIVVFQDETARRLGHDDVVAPADVRAFGKCVSSMAQMKSDAARTNAVKEIAKDAKSCTKSHGKGKANGHGRKHDALRKCLIKAG